MGPHQAQEDIHHFCKRMQNGSNRQTSHTLLLSVNLFFSAISFLKEKLLG